MLNTKNTLQPDLRWQNKNYVYETCLQYLEDIGRNDLVNDLGYVLTGYTKRQLVKASVNGFHCIIEAAERMQRLGLEMRQRYPLST